MMKHLLPCIPALVLHSLVLAQEPGDIDMETGVAQDPGDFGWDAAVELGLVATTGNTETVSVQSKADVRQETSRWRNDYVASVLFKEDQVTAADGTETTERTAERYFVSAKGGYKVGGEHSSFFAFGSHTLDEFGAYEHYTTLAVGYGSRWLQREDMTLDAEVGPGWFRGERVVDGEEEVEKGAMIRGALDYRWAITDSADFKQTLSVEAASENTRTMSETSLSTRVSNNLQLKVGYSVFHNTDVAPDKEKTDTTTFVNLVYNL